ncbi:MAG: hypothetical protein FWC73_11775 [Defluviitaleaceae bacterium]|nr:hypothetical protein [Defluviitaleaceae bacterium]
MRDNYDFKTARKNPFAGTFNGVYTVTAEHEGYNEVIKLDYNKTPPTREVLEIVPISQRSSPPMQEVNSHLQTIVQCRTLGIITYPTPLTNIDYK